MRYLLALFFFPILSCSTPPAACDSSVMTGTPFFNYQMRLLQTGECALIEEVYVIKQIESLHKSEIIEKGEE